MIKKQWAIIPKRQLYLPLVMAVSLQALTPVNYSAVSCSNLCEPCWCCITGSMELQRCWDGGGIHERIKYWKGAKWGGVAARQAVESVSSLVECGCTQLSCLCTLPEMLLLVLSQDPKHTTWEHMRAHKRSCTNKQTSCLTEGGKRNHLTMWLRHYPHGKRGTNISPCVVIILF